MYKFILELVPQSLLLSVITSFLVFFLFRYHNLYTQSKLELEMKRYQYIRDDNKELHDVLKEKETKIKMLKRENINLQSKIKKLEKTISEQKHLIQHIFNENKKLMQNTQEQVEKPTTTELKNDFSNFQFSKEFLES